MKYVSLMIWDYEVNLKDFDLILIKHYLILGALKINDSESLELLEKWERKSNSIWINVEFEKFYGSKVFEASFDILESCDRKISLNKLYDIFRGYDELNPNYEQSTIYILYLLHEIHGHINKTTL